MNEALAAIEEHACFVSANDQLGKRNTKLSFAAQLPNGESRLVIATEKLTRGTKALLVMANFCPFCGVHLP